MRTLTRNIGGIDPVPGQVYSGQVVDERDQPIHAGFVYIDADGKQIAPVSDYYDLPDGSFHFTVPDHNYQNIFLNFFSTNEYDQVVKSFSEVVNNPIVVLRRATDKLSTTLWIMGGIMGAVALSGSGRNVSGVKQTFNKQEPVVKVAAVTGAGVLIWYLLSYKPTPQQKAYLDQAQLMLDALARDQGIVPSLSTSQFSSLAVQIRRAVDKCGTDEQAIYNAFSMLNNEADIYKLILACGILKYDGCFEGSLPNWTVHYTLIESLYSDLSNSEIQHVNNILSAKGIQYRF